MTSCSRIVCKEYELLVQRLRLQPVPLDIYEFVEGSLTPTPAGFTLLGNGSPGYGAPGLILPQEGPDIDEVAFPPVDVVKLNWPVWRIELWHEVCHQVQDKQLGMWNPLDGSQGHSSGWSEAILYVADEFGWTLDQLRAVVD